MSDFSHIDDKGQAKMVDVTDKDVSERKAVATGKVLMNSETLQRIKSGNIEKGAVLETARIAAVMAVKNTPDLIPMCHQLLISGIDVEFELVTDTSGNNSGDKSEIIINVTTKTSGKTGVEMEALTGVSAAALTIYDMGKAVDRGMEIGEIKLMQKSGGSSGNFIRKDSG